MVSQPGRIAGSRAAVPDNHSANRDLGTVRATPALLRPPVHSRGLMFHPASERTSAPVERYPRENRPYRRLADSCATVLRDRLPCQFDELALSIRPRWFLYRREQRSFQFSLAGAGRELRQGLGRESLLDQRI